MTNLLVILSMSVLPLLVMLVFSTHSSLTKKIARLENELSSFRKGCSVSFMETTDSMISIKGELAQKIDKTDKLYREMEHVFRDAKKYGEGIFSVTYVTDDVFIDAIDSTKVFHKRKS